MSQQLRMVGMRPLAVAAAGTTLCCLTALYVAKPPATAAGAAATEGTSSKRLADWNDDIDEPSQIGRAADPPEGKILQAGYVATPRRELQDVQRQQQIPKRPDAAAMAAAVAAAEENAARYPDIPSAPLGIRMTMSPLAQALFHQQMREEYAAFQAEYYEESLRKIRKRQKVWQGTMAEVSQHPDVNMFERLSAARFVKLFERDPQAPQVRQQHFAAFLHPDAEQRCVSWRLVLSSAREVDDGWLVDLEAHVNLLGTDFAISMGTTKEVWHVSHDHELTFVEGSPGEDEPARVDCRP